MEALRIQAALLRAQLPDLILREGMTLVARVTERHERHGVIVLAGAPLSAELPDEVRAGDVLRLTVAETSADRVLLRVTDPAGQAPIPPGVGLPLPGGGAARITVGERDGASGTGEEPDDVRVTYHSAVLGAIDLHLALAADGVLVTVQARAGESADRARAAAEELREAIGSATARDVQVRVTERRDPLDVYA